MTKTEPRDPRLDRLATGSNCPRCHVFTDEPCKTPNGQTTDPHAARIDRAVRQFRRH